MKTDKQIRRRRILVRGWILAMIACCLAAATYGQQADRGVAKVTVQKTLSFSGNIFGLVVGISNYKYIQKLNFADDDARSVARFLKEGLKAKMVIELYDSAATRGAIRDNGLRALEDMFDDKLIQPNDLVILYFAGHGGAFDSRTSYFFPYDALTVTSNSSSIDILKIKAFCGQMRNAQVQVLLIFDACRSETIPMSPEGIKIANKFLSDDQFKEIMLAASSEGEPAKEEEGLGHGVFTYYLLKGATGEADGVGGLKDNIITATELGSYVTNSVREHTGEVQNPNFLPGDTKNARLFPITEDVSQLTASLLTVSGGKGRDIPRGSAAELATDFQKSEVLFLSSLNKGHLVKPEQANALTYYRSMKALDPKAKVLDEYRRKLLGLLYDFSSGVLDNDILGIRAYQRAVKSEDERPASPVAGGSTTASGSVTTKPVEASLKAGTDKATATTKAVSATAISATKPAEAVKESAQQANSMVSTDGPMTEADVTEAMAKTKSGYYLDYYKDALLAQQAYDELAGRKDDDSDFRTDYFTAKDLLLRYEDSYKPELLRQAASILKRRKESTAYLQFAYAQVQRKEGELELAIKEFRKAALQSPNWTFPLVELADIYLYQKNNADSAEYFIRKALSVNKSDPYPLAQIAEFYKSQSRYDSALKYYERSIQADPLIDQPYINLGDFYTNTMGNRKKGIEYYIKAYEINLRNSYLASNIAYFYLSSGDNARAEKYFLDATTLDPTNAGNYEALTNIYVLRGDVEKALETAGAAFRANPQGAFNSFQYLWGATSTSAERSQLKDEFKKLISLNGSADAFLAMGDAFQVLGLENDALEAFQKAYRIDSTYTRALESSGDILQRQGKVAEARKSYQRAVRINPASSSWVFVKWLALAPEAEQPALRLNYEKAIERVGTQEAWSALASTYVSLGRQSDAMRSYRKAIQLRPTEPDLRNLADLEFQAGLHTEAVRDMREAIRLDTLSVTMTGVSNFVTLASYLRETGSVGEARKMLRAGVNRFPETGGEALLAAYDIVPVQERLALIAQYEQGIRKIGTTSAWNTAASVFQQLKLPAQEERSYRESWARDSSSFNSTVCENLGNLYMRQGRKADALRWFRKMISLDPKYASNAFSSAANLINNSAREEWSDFYVKSAQGLNDQIALSNLGDGLLNVQMKGRAEVVFEAAIQMNPTAYDCSKVAEIKYQSGDIKAAIKMMSASVQLDTLQGYTNHYSIGELAKYLVADNRLTEARKVLSRSMYRQPEYGSDSFVKYWRLASGNERVKAARTYERLISRVGTSSAWSSLASTWMTIGSLDNAANAYRASLALDRSPNNQASMEALADVLLAQGKVPEAKAWYRESIRVNPVSGGGAFSKLLNLQDASGRKVVIDEYSKLMHQRGTRSAFIALGDALLSALQREAAIQAYSQAQTLEPQAATFATMSDIELGKGNTSESERLQRQAIALDSSLLNPNGGYHEVLVTRLIEQGRYDDAKTLARDGIRKYPEVTQGLFVRYMALLEGTAKEQAVREYESRLGKLQLASAWSSLGNSYLGASLPDRAERSFLKSIHLDSTAANALTFYSLASVIETLGRKEEAITWYRRAFQLDPQYQIESLVHLVDLDPRSKEDVIEMGEQGMAKINTADGYDTFAGTLVTLGEEKRATLAYEKSLALEPLGLRQAALAQRKYEAGDQSDGIQLMRRAVQSDSLRGEYIGVSYYETLAGWLLTDGSWDESKKILWAAIVQYKEQAGTSFQYLFGMSGVAQQDRILKSYEKVIRRVGTASAWNLLGSTLDGLRRYDAASRAYQESLLRDPGYSNTNSMDNLAADYIAMGYPEKAKPLLQLSFQLDPANGFFALEKLFWLTTGAERAKLIEMSSSRVDAKGTYIDIFNYGAELSKLGMVELGNKYLQRAASLAGTASDYQWIAENEQELGHRSASTEFLRKALQVDTLSSQPSGTKYFVSLATRLAEDGNQAHAKHLLERALRVPGANPSEVLNAYAGLWTPKERRQLMMEYHSRLKANKGTTSGEWSGFADYCKSQGWLAEAEEGYRKSVEADPSLENSSALVAMADLLREEGRLDEAMSWYRRAMELLGGDPSVFQTAWSMLDARKQRDWETFYVDLVRADPSASKYDALASALKSVGRYREAGAAYEEAMKFQPGSGELASYAMFKDELFETDKALKLIANAVQRDTFSLPPSAANFIQLATWLTRSGKKQQAQQVLSRSIYRDPENGTDALMEFIKQSTPAEQLKLLANYRKALGRIYSVDGYVALAWAISETHPVIAEQCYRDALKLDPNNRSALEGLGTFLAGQGRNTEATVLLRKAIIADAELGQTAFSQLWAITPAAGQQALVAMYTGAAKERGTVAAYEALSNALSEVRPQEAAVAMETVLAKSEAPYRLSRMGLLKDAVKDSEAALLYHERAVKADTLSGGDGTSYLWDLVSQYKRAGRSADARLIISQFMIRYPESAEYYDSLYAITAENDRPGLQATYLTRLEKAGTKGSLLTLGGRYRLMGRESDAEKALRQSLVKDSTRANEAAYENLVDALLAQGKQREAYAIVRKLLTWNSNSVVHFTKGWSAASSAAEKDQLLTDLESVQLDVVNRTGLEKYLTCLRILREDNKLFQPEDASRIDAAVAKYAAYEGK